MEEEVLMKVSITTLRLLKVRYDYHLSHIDDIYKEGLYRLGYQDGLLRAINEIEQLEANQLAKAIAKGERDARGKTV